MPIKFSRNLSAAKIKENKVNKLHHGKCFVRFYSLVEEYKESHSFATLTRSFSDTPQLLNKNRSYAFSME